MPDIVSKIRAGWLFFLFFNSALVLNVYILSVSWYFEIVLFVQLCLAAVCTFFFSTKWFLVAAERMCRCSPIVSQIDLYHCLLVFSFFFSCSIFKVCPEFKASVTPNKKSRKQPVGKQTEKGERRRRSGARRGERGHVYLSSLGALL